jgi:hypothetical protein
MPPDPKSSEGDGKYQSRNHKSLSRFQWAVRIGNPVFAAICGLFCTTLELRFRFMIPLKLGIFSPSY